MNTTINSYEDPGV